MSNSPFDYSKSICEKNYIFTDVDNKHYTSYIVNKALSFFPDTIFLVNEINMYPATSPKQHYDFLYHSVSKKKRYAKWIKQEKADEAVFLSERLQINYERAVEIMETLNETELKTLITSLDRGD